MHATECKAKWLTVCPVPAAHYEMQPGKRAASRRAHKKPIIGHDFLVTKLQGKCKVVVPGYVMAYKCIERGKSS